MQPFYLSAWIPSLKQYVKVTELKMSQLEILCKYILNDDNVHINNCFEDIILNNLQDKAIISKLTRFDKWFLLMFLRASSVGSIITYQTQTKTKENCTISYDLFDILTDLSELTIQPIENYKFDTNNFLLSVPTQLYTDDFVISSIVQIESNNDKYLPSEFNPGEMSSFIKTLQNTVYEMLKTHLLLHENEYNQYSIIKNDNNLNGFNTIPLRLLDNTLFYFLKSIFAPLAQNLYNKKYILLSKLGIDLKSINNLTPFECDVFINILNSAENSKKTKAINSNITG